MSAGVRPGLRRKLAFLLSGMFGFSLYYVLSLVLVRTPWFEQEMAALLGVLLSIPPTFLLQKRFAFRHDGSLLPSFSKYCVLQAFNAAAIALLARLGRHLGMAAEINFLLAGGIVVVVSYLALSRIVFRHDPRRGAAE
jgi:putative flippase GtrA